MPAADTGNELVRIDDLHYARDADPVFRGIDMAVPRGCVTAVLGPSGTGKTTLLRLITGQLQPDRGRILFDGRGVCPCSASRLYAMRRRIGVLFQNGALLSNLDVSDNVAYPLREHTNLPEQLVRHIVLMKLEAVGLRTAWRHMTWELSGGMARRVALARALVMDPDLVIYDEPFAGLDPIAAAVILRLIRDINDALGITSLVVTHDVARIDELADLCYLLVDGEVAAAGTPATLRGSASPVVRQFMEGRADGPAAFHRAGPGYEETLREMAGA